MHNPRLRGFFRLDRAPRSTCSARFVVLHPAADGADDWAPLVRPDGVVAWRARGPATRDDVASALAAALSLDQPA